MKNILKHKKIILLILAMLILLSSIGGSVQAITDALIDTSKKVSLTITKYEHANGNEENKELAGAEFTVYEIPNTIATVEEAESYIKNNEVVSYTKTTPSNGTVTFSKLNQGRYLVAETNAPKNVLKKVESFLIDLPRMTDDGTSWNYDVTVYPKNITIYGSVTLNEISNYGGRMQGTEWILQKQDGKGEWQNYDNNVYVTDELGQFTINNLEVGKYRLIEESTTEGYIINQSEPLEFTIDTDNINQEITTESEMLNIRQYVSFSDGTYGVDIGKFTTDVVSWMTEVDVSKNISKMSEYSVTETIDDGLIVDSKSIHIYGMGESGEKIEISDENYLLDIRDNEININFETSKLKDYNIIFINYDTTFDNSVKRGEFKINAKLTYTDFIDLDGNSTSTYTTDNSYAEVHTGSILILKTDSQNNPLEGAKFKISTSKENAENGIFIKDANSNDVIATSDENGYVIFNGLKYGNNGEQVKYAKTSYWIVEVQAPSYEENGETKYYNLLEKPVEVQVNSTSGVFSEDDTTTIVNKKAFTLPLTGGTFPFISMFLGITIISISIFILKRKSNKSEVLEVEKNN